MLCQLICCHRQSPNKLEIELLVLNLLPDEMIVCCNVLAPLVEHGVLRHLNGRLVVDQQQCSSLLRLDPC